MSLREETAKLAGKSRAEIEAYWKTYFEAHPNRQPEFTKNPTIAEPYGVNPGDWYEPEEVQKFLDAGYEWDGGNQEWIWPYDGDPDEDDYSEESEP